MKGLTKRQSEVLSYIQQFIQKNQYSPSYREIMNHFDFNSLGSVYKHVTVLKRKGVLDSEKKASRSLAPAQEGETRATSKEKEIALIGQISEGKMIELFPQSQMITVPEDLVHESGNTYALRVFGDSLRDELMMDGDVLIVEARVEAQPGETIVGFVNQHETIVKKYYAEGAYVRLVGQNPHHQSIILKNDDVLIQGIVVGLVRLYRT
jgi:repressor LexA